jgi:hypothetical protein
MATNDINSIIVESLSVAKCIISVGMSLENLEKPLQPEASHFKCRYDINNRNCQTKLYTRTTNIEVTINLYFVYLKPIIFSEISSTR